MLMFLSIVMLPLLGLIFSWIAADAKVNRLSSTDPDWFGNLLASTVMFGLALLSLKLFFINHSTTSNLGEVLLFSMVIGWVISLPAFAIILRKEKKISKKGKSEIAEVIAQN